MNDTVRLDLRFALPIVGVAVVILVIIFVELCGREDVDPLVQGTPVATATPGAVPTGEATPVPGETEVVSTPEGGQERDEQRLSDLQSIQSALEQYREDNGSYPSTEGNFQTLCVFQDADVGCALEEFLSPLPQDPLGDPAANGYWLVSTDDTFTVFAQRETDRFPRCAEDPEFLQDVSPLLCLQGR